MHIELGNRRLRASAWMTLTAFFAALMFAELGRWQWHRAAQKRQVAAEFAAGVSHLATDLGSRSTATLARYAPVRVSGTYDIAHQFLLDNMSHAGQTGYEVLTPLRLNDGRQWLVNRGWVPLPGRRRDTLPDVALADLGDVTLTGRVDELPVTGLSAGRAPPDPDTLWPKRTSFPTAAQLAASLGHAIEPRQLLLDANDAHGFVRDWHSASASFGPERHMSYAVQWWGLGALTVFLYLFMNVERRRP